MKDLVYNIIKPRRDSYMMGGGGSKWDNVGEILCKSHWGNPPIYITPCVGGSYTPSKCVQRTRS